MFELQRAILEMIAKGESLVETAEKLCREVERSLSNTVCAITTVDLHGGLHPLAAPSVPRSAIRDFDGLAVGPDSGGSAAAAYLRRPVISPDFETDPIWQRYRHITRSFGLKACWSHPVFDSFGTVVGTLSVYLRECREPTADENEFLTQCVNLCAIALDRQRRLMEFERRATTDDLTKLRNRSAFSAALKSLDCDTPGSWAVAIVDLDNMKVVNDTFSHTAGDMLIQHVSDQLASIAAPNPVFRIGGDEFAVLISDTDCLASLDECASRYLDAITTACDCYGTKITPRAYLGIAVLSLGDRLPERVRQNADFALYHAKETGRGKWVRYWPGIGTRMTRRLNAIREVDAALRENRLEAHYQPIVRIQTGEIVGLEALCRMRLGEKLIPAAAFHEATTDAQIATALTRRMMELVANDVRSWLAHKIPFQHVSINVTSADFYSGTLTSHAIEAFGSQGVSLAHVILEVTELVYMADDAGLVQETIGNLRKEGVTVALDDFGTGYASLTHLMSIAADYIKIDKSFVDRIVDHPPSVAIVEGMIGIAHKLGMQVVAEGVETEAQALRLSELGCTMAQGYFYSPAVSGDQAKLMMLDMAEGASNQQCIKRWQVGHATH